MDRDRSQLPVESEAIYEQERVSLA